MWSNAVMVSPGSYPFPVKDHPVSTPNTNAWNNNGSYGTDGFGPNRISTTPAIEIG
jgi:hypothetical protein